ncbi:MAG: hypothetical protein U5N86_08060 [Planctomycetota bacterium]|nr:hypothetical protein [Planctomycetota bacterium]
MVHSEGRKHYALTGDVLANLLMGDEYTFTLTGIESPDIGASPEFPIFVEGGQIQVKVADFPMIFGPHFNPPLETFNVRPIETGVAVMSFTVLPAPEFDSRLRSLMIVRRGDAPGELIRVRFYIDRGTKGIFEPGTDIDVTADSLDSHQTASQGYSLGFGQVSDVIDIPLLAQAPGEDFSQSMLYLPRGGNQIEMLAVCDFSLTAQDIDTTLQLQLVGMRYTGDETGLVNLTLWRAYGSHASVILAEQIVQFRDAPAYDPDEYEYFVPGAKEVRLAWISAYPSSLSGDLHSFELHLSGTGDDVNALDSLEVLLDVNNNGFRDSSDWSLHSTPPSSNDPVSNEITVPSGMGRFEQWNGGTQRLRLPGVLPRAGGFLGQRLAREQLPNRSYFQDLQTRRFRHHHCRRVIFLPALHFCRVRQAVFLRHPRGSERSDGSHAFGYSTERGDLPHLQWWGLCERTRSRFRHA